MEELKSKIKELKSKIKELKDARAEVKYWIDNCENDLKDMNNFSCYESYHGCKLVLEENQKEYEELTNDIEILEKAIEILER